MPKLIAVASDDDRGLEGMVSPHFGRCPFYTMVTVEGGNITDVKVVPNPYAMNHAPGQVPAYLQSLGINTIIAGGMGQRAIGFFTSAGIEVVTGAMGNIGRVLRAYLSGEITGAQPCSDSEEHAHSHAAQSPAGGMGPGRGMGGGMGPGRGMGGGMGPGRGMGGGMGPGRGMGMGGGMGPGRKGR